MEPSALVHTPSGTVRGVWEPAGASAPVAVFKGIPYAEPPVGADRYAAPRPRAPWTDVRDATAFGPTPMRREVDDALIPESSVPGDDILSVNVWTPTPTDEASLPVVVWIHGGGYLTGSPASPWYDGRAFARDGVVFVTLSYRLGFRGFGWIEGATPNRGVLDWICALEWVRDHIAAFGGDPTRVTVAGQSAGASAVLTLLGAPGAAGLFHAGVAISPAVANASLDAAREHGARLARLARITNDETGFLSIPEARVLELQAHIAMPAAPHLLHDVHEILREGLLLGPVADGTVVRVDPQTAASTGVNAGVPLLIGTTDDEVSGLFSTARLLDHLPPTLLMRVLGADRATYDAWRATPEHAHVRASTVLLGHYATDAFFRSRVPAIATQRARTEAAGDTYTYRFAWHGPDSAGAGHCSDLPFFFDRLDVPGVERVVGGPPPQPLADAAHGAFVAFAGHGTPGWGPDAGHGPTRIFDVPVRDACDAYASAALLRTP